MNNAVFNKIIENVRNHVNMRLLTRWEGRYGAEALIAKSNFHTHSSSTYPRHVCMNFITIICCRCIARNVKSVQWYG